MRKPTTTLLGSQTVKLGRVLHPITTRGFWKIEEGFSRIHITLEMGLDIFQQSWKFLMRFGGIWVFSIVLAN